MLSKSEKSFCLISLALLACSTARATVTVIPDMVGVDRDIAYFAVEPLLGNGVMDQGFKAYDLKQDQATEAGTSRPNMFRFQVSTDKSVSADTTKGQVVVLTVFAKKSGSDDYLPAPIAWAGGKDCVDQVNCQSIKGNNHLFAARFNPGEPLTIGIYPKDICRDIRLESGAPTITGCEGDNVLTPTAGVHTRMELKFTISAAADNKSSGKDEDLAETKSLALNLQVDSPELVCAPTLDSVYFPGDGQIIVDPTHFQIGTSKDAAQRGALVVVAKEGEYPTPIDPFDQGMISGRINFDGKTQGVPGFINTTDGKDHLYQVYFTARDMAGIVAPFKGGCTIQGVQTTSIEGVMKQGNCFIATAAYRAPHAGPVRMLREFRDRVLLRAPFGAQLVRTYYAWSPDAANWLMNHPEWRLPVLWLLLPIEILAWLFLHPFLAGALAGVGAIVIFMAMPRRRLRAGAVISLLVLSIGIGSAQAEDGKKSVSPYIDQIKKDLPEEKKEEGSFTEKMKKSLPPEKFPESLIENIKKRDPDAGQSEHQESYSKKRKSELEPKEEGGAIQAVKDGKSDLEMKKPGDIRHAAGVRVGAIQDLNIKGGGGNSMEAVFGATWNPNVALFYEFQPFHSEWFGSVGLMGNFGLNFYKGKGRLEFELNNPVTGQKFDPISKTEIQLFAVPAILGAVYRFNLLRIVRPYVQGGAGMIGYHQKRSDGLANHFGYSTSALVGVGAALLLNWFDRKADWSLYEEQGIHHFYLTADYTRFIPISGDIKYAVSGFSGGLAFEF